jgi:hypothetical protein
MPLTPAKTWPSMYKENTLGARLLPSVYRPFHVRRGRGTQSDGIYSFLCYREFFRKALTRAL